MQLSLIKVLAFGGLLFGEKSEKKLPQHVSKIATRGKEVGAGVLGTKSSGYGYNVLSQKGKRRRYRQRISNGY